MNHLPAVQLGHGPGQFQREPGQVARWQWFRQISQGAVAGVRQHDRALVRWFVR